MKNFLATTILSVGMPMMVMGDEVRRTQRGNNNAYCHDDETTWFDWTLIEKHADIVRFVTLLNERLPIGERHPSTLTQLLREANRTWHGIKVQRPDWRDDSHSLAVSAEIRGAKLRLYMALNSYWEPLQFELPPPSDAMNGPWRRRIDTFLDSPHDIVDWRSAAVVPGDTYRVQARSMVLLFSESTS